MNTSKILKIRLLANALVKVNAAKTHLQGVNLQDCYIIGEPKINEFANATEIALGNLQAALRYRELELLKEWDAATSENGDC